MAKGNSGFVQKSKKEQSFDGRFKKYEYNGRIIYKVGPGQYALFDRKTDAIVRTETTLKDMKTAVDKWNDAIRNKKKK